MKQKLKIGQDGKVDPQAGKFFDAIFNDPAAEESQAAC